ncbi:ABC transporter permease [Burkholderia ubonensis]|uniref:ABC transporter permease n=1 Tax=Burkholderia ubonensis TaxID=101571 RepID=UPI0007530117|nr:ABC transporter permease [Burkholderia ubonensis]KVS39904.1 ribose ABC transporter permease [Burkholderia ubonensis]KVS47999.1 ribose ABC transporter permease [Burkholderia ubonensis]KVS78733.1 ribose ABC transporter permease [Burkholderia ubonensis]KVS93466.1 ribose ABC transporter permease [Burkholderia ubonensis]KVS94211.1 ribose ABC transporter permease [Burkholderia ubonensis]
MNTGTHNLSGRWTLFANGRYSIYLILVAMIVVSSIISPVFLSAGNFSNISRQISITTILAFGQTLLIICGLIDLSAGSVLALSGLLSVMFYKATGLFVPSMIVGIAIGSACGLVNGWIVTRFNTPAFIATLAMQTAARGGALMLTGGQNIYELDKFVGWGQGAVLGVPSPVIFLVLIALLTWYLLNHTRLGRYIYAIGGNQEAARASGIRISRIKMAAFIVNGALVGLAGVLYMSRVNAGLPNAGIGFEFDAMTAAIIGGTSFSGGIGTAIGTLAGAFIMGFLGNIMNLLGVQSYLQQIIKGGIIVLAVAYDISSKHGKKKKKAPTATQPEQAKVAAH